MTLPKSSFVTVRTIILPRLKPEQHTTSIGSRPKKKNKRTKQLFYTNSMSDVEIPSKHFHLQIKLLAARKVLF